MACGKQQRGFLLVVAIVLLVVGSMLAASMAYMVATSGGSATDNLQSGQALFLADSGGEFEARRMAQNLDWYRSSTDPTATSGPQALGAGTFTTSSNLPATKLRRRLLSGATGAGAAVCVYTINRFPSSGTVQIDDDIGTGAEFVTYTGTTASSAACGNLPAFTGLTRGVVIAGTGAVAADHSRDDIAYPVTTLVDPLAVSATCVAPAQLRINDNTKFLSSGTISLDDGGVNSEDISYATSSRAGGVMTLTGLQRLLGAGCPAWAAGAPVRPQLANSTGGSGNDYEAQASAVGNVGSTQRTINRVLQR
jgi:hypothetical protein